VNQITRKTFDKSLAKFAPCSLAKSDGANQAEPNVEDLNSLILGNEEDGHHN